MVAPLEIKSPEVQKLLLAVWSLPVGYTEDDIRNLYHKHGFEYEVGIECDPRLVRDQSVPLHSSHSMRKEIPNESTVELC